VAIRYAVANGDWSSTSTWNGGTLPASGDDVYANNFTVNIDQSITVNKLRKVSNGSPSIAAGGVFDITAAATVNITSGIISDDNTSGTYMLRVNAGAATVAINAPSISGGGGSLTASGVHVATGYTGALTITATILCGVAGSGVYVEGASTQISIVGNVSPSAGAWGVRVRDSAQVAITGDITPTSSSVGVLVEGDTSRLVVTGDVAASTGVYGVQVSGSTAQVAINGDVLGGNSTGYGVYLPAASAELTVIGSVRGGSGSTGYGVYATAGYMRLDALLKYGSAGCAPIHCTNCIPQFKRSGTVLGIEAPSDDNWPDPTGAVITVQGGSGGDPGSPDAADVRLGTLYGPDGDLEGALAVPPPSLVSAGVPTDDTVGTAALSLSDVLAGTGAQIAAATSG
jgi:hypothetical protein